MKPFPVSNFEQITTESLIDASLEHFNSEAYGLSAASLLDYLRREYANFNPIAKLFLPLSSWTGDSELWRQAFEYWKLVGPIPFEPAATYGGTTKVTIPGVDTQKIWNLVIGHPSKYRLGNFVRSNAWDYHTHTGSLGKALDILGIVGKVVERPSVIKEFPPEDFITYEEIQDRVDEAKLSGNTLSFINQALGNCIIHQLRFSRWSKREVVFEGSLVFSAASPKFEKIKRDSLRYLTDPMDSKGAPAREFFSQFSE